VFIIKSKWCQQFFFFCSPVWSKLWTFIHQASALQNSTRLKTQICSSYLLQFRQWKSNWLWIHCRGLTRTLCISSFLLTRLSCSLGLGKYSSTCYHWWTKIISCGMTEAAPVFDMDPCGHLHPNMSFIYHWSESIKVKTI